MLSDEFFRSSLPCSEDRKLPAAEDGDQAQGILFADIWRGLLQNKWLILVCALVAVAGSTLYVIFATPIYQATTSIRMSSSTRWLPGPERPAIEW
jgi:uncharacterized protein involved in exopolysaccharide biosynthesis